MLPVAIAPVVPSARPPASGRSTPGVGWGDPLDALLAHAAARRRHPAALAPEAGLARRLERAAGALRPPAVVARELGRGADPLASPLVRAWVARVLRLPPPLTLLALARAHWFLPACPAARRRRMAIARALLDGLERPGRPVDAALRAFLATGPLADAAGGPILARGLAAYAARDYLTCLHLLVPRLEAVLRGLARRLAGGSGAATVAGAGLAGLLGREPLRRALGDGLALHLRAVLLDGGGLRHRLAHGRLPPAACTRRASQDVILCYLRLSGLSVPAAAATAAAPPGRPAAARDGGPAAIGRPRGGGGIDG